MLKKQDQTRYLNREITALITFLSNLCSAKPGKKQIHDVRINIKRIKALIEVNKIRGYSAGMPSLLGLNYLFKTTGSIRTSQLIIESLKSSGIDDKKIVGYHQDLLSRASKKMVSEVPKHLEMAGEFRTEMKSGKLENITEEQVLLYHELKSEYLGQLFKTPPDPDLLHEGRKQIKHLIYIREMIKPVNQKKIPFHYERLDELQRLVGKWHDSLIFLDCLDEFKFDKKHQVRKELSQKLKAQFDEIRSFLSKDGLSKSPLSKSG